MIKILNGLKKYVSDPEELNFLVNVLLAFGVKGVSLMISVLSTPLYIRYFNNNSVLGVWYTILSLLTWISVCDLGLGNGLRNKLTEQLAGEKYDIAQKYVSSTYAALACIMIPVALVGVGVLWSMDLNRFFQISSDEINANALRSGVIILFVGIAVSFIIKPVNNILYALQKSSINNIITLITSVIPLIYIIFSSPIDTGTNFLRLSIVHVFSIEIPLLFASVVVFKATVASKFVPKFNCVQFSMAKEVTGFGLQFFGAQVFFLLIMSTNEIMISKLYAASNVVEYNIYYKLFTFVGSIFMLALTPLWSKITRDLALKRYGKIKNTLKVLCVCSLLATIGDFLLILCLQEVLNIWLGKNSFLVNYNTAVIFAFFGGVYIFNTSLTTVANGLGKMKSQIIIYGIGALLKVPSIIFIKSFLLNWHIVTLYNAVILFIFCCVEALILRKMLNKWRETEIAEDGQIY